MPHSVANKRPVHSYRTGGGNGDAVNFSLVHSDLIHKEMLSETLAAE